ncbi:hypothetical protein LRR18_16725, partial [Mangrovimonas sp. AS39]|uniref:hypothetical protein n=1 Tax=Mangrovimonas futianensis TaxID=2895523 RepID=UPI001E43E6CA
MAGKPNPPKEYAKEPTGRPSKFTPERCAAIIDDIAHRVPYEFAAEANGISEATLYVWLEIGKDHQSQGISSDYAVFLEGIKRAEKDRIRGHAENIADHVDKWQADAWMLERRWHKHYGPNAQLNELNRRLDELQKNDKKNDDPTQGV